MKPFHDTLEHTWAHLGRIDLLLRIYVARVRQLLKVPPERAAYRGLVIADADLELALDRRLGAPPWVSAELPPVPETLIAEFESMDEVLAEREKTSTVDLALVTLRESLGLDEVDQDILLLALAPEVDGRFERFYGWLNDDVSRQRPTVELCMNMLSADLAGRGAVWARFSSEQPLMKWGLLSLSAPGGQAEAPRLRRELKVDDGVVAWLLGQENADGDGAHASPTLSSGTPEQALRLATLLQSETEANGQRRPTAGTAILLWGPRGAGRRSLARHACEQLGTRPFEIDLTRLEAEDPSGFEAEVLRAFRRSRLTGMPPMFSGFEVLTEPDRTRDRQRLWAQLERHTLPTILVSTYAWTPVGMGTRVRLLNIEQPAPSVEEQRAVWASVLGDSLADKLDLDLILRAASLTPGDILEAAHRATSWVDTADESDPLTLQKALIDEAKRQNRPNLGPLATVMRTPHTWDDLVLNEDAKSQLLEICGRVRGHAQVYDAWGFRSTTPSGKGTHVLFAGPPGTGKTLAAGILGAELGVDVYRIDLSSVVSKYIGETEKHLEQLFRSAEQASSILFFDEADALFGKRSQVKDAHDRYANIQVSYLLQRMETYSGLVVLATNLRGNMDPAFVRRLHAIVSFEEPDERARAQIWARMWPPGCPLAADVDSEELARRFVLTGGEIHNSALAAAFEAAVTGDAITLANVEAAVRREYLKNGRIFDAS